MKCLFNHIKNFVTHKYVILTCLFMAIALITTNEFTGKEAMLTAAIILSVIYFYKKIIKAN